MNKPFNQNFTYFSKVFLEEITKNAKFKTEFQAFATEIYADIESYSKNPNCSCRAKVEKFVNDNREKCYIFIKKFIEQNNIEIDVSAIEGKYKTTPYSGKIIQVKKSDWASFVDIMQRDKATFRAFSVVKLDEETSELYFI